MVLVTKISSPFSADIPAESPQHRTENLRAWGGKLGAVPAISGPFLVKTCDKWFLIEINNIRLAAHGQKVFHCAKTCFREAQYMAEALGFLEIRR